MRQLDVLGVRPEDPETRVEAGLSPVPLASFPVEAGELPALARRHRGIAARLGRAPHRLVVLGRLAATTGETPEIAQPLADGEPFPLADLPGRERLERHLVVSDGIVIGIDASRPVARGHHVACALELLLAPAEVMGEDRKSTRLNSSHVAISYAVFCLKKKK